MSCLSTTQEHLHELFQLQTRFRANNACEDRPVYKQIDGVHYMWFSSPHWMVSRSTSIPMSTTRITKAAIHCASSLHPHHHPTSTSPRIVVVGSVVSIEVVSVWCCHSCIVLSYSCEYGADVKWWLSGGTCSGHLQYPCTHVC